MSADVTIRDLLKIIYSTLKADNKHVLQKNYNNTKSDTFMKIAAAVACRGVFFFKDGIKTSIR